MSESCILIRIKVKQLNVCMCMTSANPRLYLFSYYLFIHRFSLLKLWITVQLYLRSIVLTKLDLGVFCCFRNVPEIQEEIYFSTDARLSFSLKNSFGTHLECSHGLRDGFRSVADDSTVYSGVDRH